jgi:hypothetical protein
MTNVEKPFVSKASAKDDITGSCKSGVNDAGTGVKAGSELTQPRSGPVRYELVRADGEISPMKFDTAAQAVEAAGYLWPDQSQDPDRTGNGWDVQIAGDGRCQSKVERTNEDA